MRVCGFHLRCLNHRNRCLECRHQNDDTNKDYLFDALNVWPKGQETDCVTTGEKSQYKTDSANGH
ncbi:MAG: hypothetical protein HQL26_06815 [Candidatus Omnitrophica bacterium]|nr:hypothetical protein [Candidatus Omnitrophota bacterium]